MVHRGARGLYYYYLLWLYLLMQAERVAHARAVGELRAQLEMETAAMQEELTRERQAT